MDGSVFARDSRALTSAEVEILSRFDDLEPGGLAAFGHPVLEHGFSVIPIEPGEKRPAKALGKGWQRTEATPATLAGWIGNGHARDGLGILSRTTPGVDLDIMDAQCARHMEEWVRANIGAAPVRYGLHPKRLMLFRTEEPFRKITSRKWITAEGRECKVEILCDGQQFVAFHIHPDTGQPYEWRGDRGPHTVSRAELRELTEDGARRIVAEFERYCEAQGWTVVGAKPAAPAPLAGPVAAAREPPDWPRIRSALAAIPVDAREGRETYWRPIGMALHHASGGSEEGFEEWDAWSAPAGNYDARDQRRVWESFKGRPAGQNTTIATLFAKAKEYGWKNPRPAPPPADPATGRFGRLRLLSVADALNAPARTHLLGGLIAPGEFSVWWGKPKTAKTFLLLRLAYGLALGRGMWGREAARVPVLYLAAEGQSGILHRVAALAAELGDAGGRFHFIAQSADLFAPEADVQSVIDAAKHTGARLVVVDTLARVMAGANEDKAQDMGATIRNFDRIREETGAHVAVVHHGAKGGGDTPRGSSALMGAADAIVALSRTDDGRCKAELTDAKDDPSGDTLGFQLRTVDLGPDGNGRARVTCIAEEAATAAAPRPEKPLTETQRGWLRDLREMFDDSEETVERAPREGSLPALTLTREQVREGLRVRGRFAGSPDGTLTGADRERMRAALNTLKDKGKIGLTDELVWLL